MTEDQVEELNETIMEMEYYSDFDFYVVTTCDNDGLGAQGFAENYAAQKTSSLAGAAVFLLDMDDNEAYICAMNGMLDVLTTDVVNEILDKEWVYLPEKEYYEYFCGVLADTEEILFVSGESVTEEETEAVS